MIDQGHGAGPTVRRPGMRGRFAALLASAVAALAALTTGTGEGNAQANNVIRRGDAVVTGFAGTVAPENLPQDVHPLDRTFIDLQGLTAQIKNGMRRVDQCIAALEGLMVRVMGPATKA